MPGPPHLGGNRFTAIMLGGPLSSLDRSSGLDALDILDEFTVHKGIRPDTEYKLMVGALSVGVLRQETAHRESLPHVIRKVSALY